MTKPKPLTYLGPDLNDLGSIGGALPFLDVIAPDGTDASCVPPAPPKLWTFGDQQREWPHILGREAHAAWCESRIQWLTDNGFDRETALRWLVYYITPYDGLPVNEREAWDAAAQAAYEHGEKDGKEAAEEAFDRGRDRW